MHAFMLALSQLPKLIEIRRSILFFSLCFPIQSCIFHHCRFVSHFPVLLIGLDGTCDFRAFANSMLAIYNVAACSGLNQEEISLFMASLSHAINYRQFIQRHMSQVWYMRWKGAAVSYSITVLSYIFDKICVEARYSAPRTVRREMKIFADWWLVPACVN